MIDVREQLPEPYVRVLVFDPAITKFKSPHFVIRGHNQVVIGHRYAEEDLVGRLWYVPDGIEPTHLMPLQEEPGG